MPNQTESNQTQTEPNQTQIEPNQTQIEPNQTQYVTVTVPMIFMDDVYRKYRGVFASVEKIENAEVGSILFLTTSGDVKAYGVITEVESPNENKRGDLPDKARWKYHWSESQISLSLSALCGNRVPKNLKNKRILIDIEDKQRIMNQAWWYSSTNKSLLTITEKRKCSLQRFLLHQCGLRNVYQVTKGLDFTKKNLTTRLGLIKKLPKEIADKIQHL